MYVSFGIERASVAARIRTDSLPYMHMLKDEQFKWLTLPKSMNLKKILLVNVLLTLLVPFYCNIQHTPYTHNEGCMWAKG